jgi:MFS transporter, DHA1 family, multidrug resistance protein
MLVIGIAPILSPSVGGWLMGLAGWGAIFWALGAFAAACGLFVLVDLPETLPASRRDREPVRAVFPKYAAMIVDRRFLAYALPSGLALGTIFAYVASAPTLFLGFYRLSPGGFSLAFASIAVGLIGSAQVNRWLTRRHDTHAILRAAGLANAAAGLALPALAWTGVGGFPAFYAAIFVCLSTVGLIMPNATAAVMAPFPDRAGVASALLGMLQFAVGAATGALVGVFHDGTGRPMALTMAGCATVGAAILVAAGRKAAEAPAAVGDAGLEPASA